MWESISPGITVRPLKSISTVRGPASARISSSVPAATMTPLATAKACPSEKSLSTVRTLAPVSMSSARFLFRPGASAGCDIGG
jgi:hypothetical protein